MFKKIISVFALISILLPSVQAFASDGNLISINNKNMHGNSIPNLEENGESLQYSKGDLSNKLIDSKLKIKSLNISSDNKVSIEGTLHYNNNDSKELLLTGEVQNSSEENKERIIFKLTDSLDNFEVIDFSLYKSSEDLSLFDSSINKNSNKNIFTLYLLDKENRNFTIFEDKFNNSNEINNLFDNRENFNSAAPEDLLWISKVLKVTQTELTENPVLFASIADQSYTYTKSYTYFGVPYKDALTVNMQISYDASMTNYGSTTGHALMSVVNNTSTNLNTGKSTTSFLYIGKGTSPKIQVAVNQDMAFTYTSPNGAANTSPSLSLTAGYSIGTRIPGLSFDLSLDPFNRSVTFGGGTNFLNYPSSNKFVRTYVQNYSSSLYLFYPNNYLATNFTIGDFSSTKNSFNISAKYTVPFYNLFDGGTTTYTFGVTTPLISQR